MRISQKQLGGWEYENIKPPLKFVDVLIPCWDQFYFNLRGTVEPSINIKSFAIDFQSIENCQRSSGSIRIISSVICNVSAACDQTLSIHLHSLVLLAVTSWTAAGGTSSCGSKTVPIRNKQYWRHNIILSSRGIDFHKNAYAFQCYHGIQAEKQLIVCTHHFSKH